MKETVNPLVASSNLASGVYVLQALRVKTLGAFLFAAARGVDETTLFFDQKI